MNRIYHRRIVNITGTIMVPTTHSSGVLVTKNVPFNGYWIELYDDYYDKFFTQQYINRKAIVNGNKLWTTVTNIIDEMRKNKNLLSEVYDKKTSITYLNY